eukprot:jgi/Ulvmu1/3188/UM015_0229.1
MVLLRLFCVLSWLTAAAVWVRWTASARTDFYAASTDRVQAKSTADYMADCSCSHRDTCEDGATCDGVIFGPSRGAFPHGCRWREISPSNGTDQYEYWDELEHVWVDLRPSACTIKLESADGYVVKSKAPRESVRNPATIVDQKATHTVITNLWYNNGRWYAIVEGETFINTIKISRNQQVTTVHVKNATAWFENVKHNVVRGDTLLFDYIFFVHPTAIGHWCEMLFPLFSVLKESAFKVREMNMLLLHLRRKHLMEWVRNVIATTLRVPPGDSLPSIWLQEDADDSHEQLVAPLQGIPAEVWLCFERAIIVKDLFTGGKRSFASSSHAREFRAKIYEANGLVAPPSSSRGNKPPQVITFQRKRANRRIVNEAQLLDLLRTYAPVQVVEFNSSHSFAEQLTTISKTGIFVSAHTSNLANAIFLPPGSAVIELIQRFWSWRRLDQSFKDQTDLMGDIHHFAWRAFHENQTVYLDPRDSEKFGKWTLEQCHVEECVEAHTNVDVIVDLDQLKTMLDARIPRVLSGESVKKMIKAGLTVWPDANPDGPQPWKVIG